MPVGEALFKSAQGTLLIVGIVLWVRALISGRAQRWLESPARLPAWPIGLGDFLLLPFIAVVLLLFVPQGILWLGGIEVVDPPTPEMMLVGGYGMGLALIGAALVFRLLPSGHPGESHESLLRAIGTGLLALVYFLPACLLLALGWTFLLESLGWPSELQDVIHIIRDTDNPLMLAQWFLVVAVLAPLGEELVFRAGLFRFLANRTRPFFAAVISAALFATIHWNAQAAVPLFALGLVLAAVYHKTGRLLAAITLHAAFNLNTLLGLLSGAVQ